MYQALKTNFRAVNFGYNICNSLKEILKCDDHLNEQHFPVFCGLTIESVDEILKYHHSDESYLAVLFGGTVNSAVQGGSYFLVCEKKN